MSNTSPSYATIDLKAYAHNIDVIQNLVGEHVGLMAVVKADAYGHGMVRMAQEAIECKAKMLGVATVGEGVTLRQAGIDAPILVMVQPDPGALPNIIEHQLSLMISDVATAEHLGELARRANKIVAVHCKIDSGMGRQGFALDSAPTDLSYLTRISHIDVVGIATHFPSADHVDDPFTYNQIKAFKQLLKQLDKLGIPYEVAHAANSAALLNYQGSTFDLARVGLLTYGVWPTEDNPDRNLFRPVLRWETRVTQVRDLEPGSSVGYGRTYTTPSRMRVALLAVGYADGYQHSLSNRADVLIQGKRCPVRGSVCMDQIIVDVTQLENVRPGDTATLIGSDGNEHINVEELAKRANTIPYEILAGIGPRVPRDYIT